MCSKSCITKIFCRLCCRKKFVKKQEENRRKNIEEPRYVPEPSGGDTFDPNEEGSVYGGSLNEPENYYEEPISKPRPFIQTPILEPIAENINLHELTVFNQSPVVKPIIENVRQSNLNQTSSQEIILRPMSKNNRTNSSSSNTISLSGSQLALDRTLNDNEDTKEPVFKVIGVIEMGGNSQEICGTLRLGSDKTNLVQVHNNSFNIKGPEGKVTEDVTKPDIIPFNILKPYTNTQNNSRNNSITSTSTIKFLDHRRVSNGSLLSNDEETAKIVRKVLKRDRINENESNSNGETSTPNFMLQEHSRRFSTIMNVMNGLSRSDQEINTVSENFQRPLQRTISTPASNTVIHEDIPSINSAPEFGNSLVSQQQPEYNVPYDHLQELRDSGIGSTLSINSSEPRFYGNRTMIEQNSIHLQSKATTRKSPVPLIGQRPPMPAPRTRFSLQPNISEEEHKYEYIY